MKPPLSTPKLTGQETQFIQQLRQQPQRLARLQSILDLAHAADRPLQTADEVEARLIQALRQLGHTTMQQWATQAEARVSAELQAQDATVRGLKKNADVVVRLWSGAGERAALAQPEPALPPPFARTPGGEAAGTVAAAGAGADGLRLRAFLCPGGGPRP